MFFNGSIPNLNDSKLTPFLGSVFETASNQAHATTWSCKSSGSSAAVVGSSNPSEPCLPTTSTISTADLSFLQPPSVHFLASFADANSHLQPRRHFDPKQLTHISATSSDVALPGFFGMVSQDQATNISRLERMGRATLRKTQAIEDDDHLTSVTCQSSIDSGHNSLSVPSHNLPNSKGNSFEEDDAFKQPNQLLLGSTGHFPAQPPMPGSVALALNSSSLNPLSEAAIQLLMQQRQINKETFQPTDSILSSWTKSGDLFANQLLNLTHGPLAGFGFPNLVQSHSVDITSNSDEYRAAAVAAANSVTATIADRKPHSFDMAKFSETRNVHSTESTASTSSEPCFRGSDVPRKSVIQDDIRMNKGRFALVKKRGRSDVWNLFGQVMDNLTNQRLPYVACYACKVLYTDTGGGTGNMTRHRCPLGNSYRNLASSSTDTMNDSFNAQSSFESYHGNSPDNGKESPVANHLLHCLPRSGSKSFETVTTTTLNLPPSVPTTLRSLQTQISNISSVSSITLQASSSSTESAPPGLLSSSLSVEGPSTPVGPPPLLVLSSGVAPSTPTQSIEAEKENMLKIVAQYCIGSFELPNIINKPSFIKLLEETFSCSQRLFPPNNQNASDLKSFAELLPTEPALAQFIKRQSNVVRDKLRKHFKSAQANGIMLICQGLRFGERRMMTVWTSFISDTWKYERICIAVKEDETDLRTFLTEVATDYEFVDAKQIYVTLDDSISPHDRTQLPGNMKYVENVVQAINQIVAASINESVNMGEIIKTVKLYQQIVRHTNSVDSQSCYNNNDQIVNIMELYRLLKHVRIRYDSLRQLLVDRKMDELLEDMDSIDKVTANSLESLLEPFYEVAQTLDSDDIPHFHTILPEWHALIHECAPVDDDSESHGKPISLSDRPRRRSLRHQKSIDDEPNLQIVDDESNPAPACENKDKWMKNLRRRIEQKLRHWASENIDSTYMIATALNPLMRKLQIICSDPERLLAYSKIRQNAGLKHTMNTVADHGEDYEPQRKRQNFLNKIEDQGMVQDELDNYLNIQLTRQDKRSVLEFWGKIQNLPKLSQYAKSILALVAAASPLQLKHVANHALTDDDFSDMLILKTSSTFIDTHDTN